ncbi:hypothetical protein DUNSADRAFT_18644 [Dunaliella salina]|uniref:Uncharacterized protein n=1 Tax=Dunaliella salina TaxID=3046 RepID=A0ABQ7GYS9_DUNSA|nr:hypothetical protein DUNSADRAFT_18644 [Dunaliella salina]|eukprot:KAF5839766.1 hypothetical protein DUNSADRAFT_18644 [Dunaliella salina]
MRRSLHTLAADLHQIIKRHEPAPFWSHAWLGLPHAPNSAPFSSAGDGRGGSNYKGRIQHPRKGPKSRLAALPSQQDRALSQQSPQGLQRMLSSFPAKLTPVHVHSVLAWAIDHYEQQGAVRVRKASAEIGHVPSSMPQSVAMPLRDGRAAQGNGSAQLQQKEHGLMEDILRDLVLKLNGFQRWDQHLLQACNRLATHPAAPPRVRAHATTLTAAAVRQVLIDRSWGQGQVQAMATLVSNSLATLSHDSEPQRHAATLRDALDGLPALIPLMNIVPSWRTALILTQLELPHIPTFKAIASRFKYPEILGNLSAKELALLGHAFALVGARSEGLFDLMSKLLGYNNKLDQMNWKDISMLAWALYRLDLKSSPLLSTLASAVNHLSSTATAAVPQQQIMAPPPPSTPPPPSPLSRDSFGGHHYGPANSSESPVHPIHIAASAQPLNPTSPAPTLSNPPGFLHMERLEHTTGTHAWNHGFPCVETAQGRAQHLPSLSNSVRTTHERAQLPISPTHLLSLSRHCLKLRSRHARPLAAALCNVGAAVMAGNLQMVPCEAGDAPRRTSCTQYQGREFTQGGQALREWQRRETYGGGGMQQEGPSVRMSKLGWRGTEEGILEPRLIVLLLSTAVFYR